MADLSASFAKPFDLQLAALRLRLSNLVGTAAWDDLVKAEHDRAFVVAGALKADLLADLGRAVEKAIGDHRSIEKFRAEFRQIVADRGWHGWTGEGTPKGEAWRTKVIYRTNMATSYAAGRFAQLKAAGYKFWVYKHGNALEPRLQHLAWDGVALPPDHPFWASHAPPNGWGCTCRIRGADSERGIRRAGGDPAKKLPDGWDAINAKTGEPDGIDKGWGYAPGASVADELQAFVAAKAVALPPPLAKDLVAMTAPLVGEILPASPTTPDEAIALGKQVVAELRRDLPLLDADWSRGDHDLAAISLWKGIKDKMARDGGFGGATITFAKRTTSAAKTIMARVAKVMPTAWVQKANAVPVFVGVSRKRGRYFPAWNGEPPKISTSASSTAEHEYLHHVQAMMPELDRLFQALHRRRTAGEPLVFINHKKEVGRRDHYHNAYQGREYGGTEGALEVLTMALQPVVGSDIRALEMLRDMIHHDPQMLEFALGVLFYWRP